jgi:hypothetical protein
VCVMVDKLTKYDHFIARDCCKRLKRLLHCLCSISIGCMSFQRIFSMIMTQNYLTTFGVT